MPVEAGKEANQVRWKSVRLPTPAATVLAFVANSVLAERASAEVVIWSPNFDLYHPLMDFVDVRKGKAVVVYFRPFLDPRWAQSGLFESGPIKFYDPRRSR